MMDFSPVEGVVIAFSVPAGVVECGPSSFGTADELCVNMELPGMVNFGDNNIR